MSIRSNTLPIGNTLSPQLHEVLRKNGMNARVSIENGRHMLHVQGHDSPMLSYNITPTQYRALVDGGTNSANKHAYKTFVNIVHRDFDCPKDFVHARNAFGKVVMGLHGYRREPMPVPVRNPHPGFHMRRVDGNLMMLGGTPMIPERDYGHLKPGELQSGAYGFYYKHNNQQQMDPLQELQTAVQPMQPVPQQPIAVKEEPARKYRDLIPSAVYFTNEKWQECLESHGIQVDADNKKLLVQNAGTPYCASYDLTDQQLSDLTNNKLKGDSVYHRIDIINGLIANDFQNKLTFDMLNSTEQPHLNMKQEVIQSIDAQSQQHQQMALQEAEQESYTQRDPRTPGMDNPDGINGQSAESYGKQWQRQVANGRDVNVGEVWVEKDKDNEGKYRMSAVINGEIVSHEITQKQHDRFLALDDYHRLKLFDKVFDEVKMKNIPGDKPSFGEALLAGLAAADTLTRGAADVAHNIEHIKHPHSGPDIYVEEPHRHGRIFVKAGLDTPETIVQRAFDAGMSQGFYNAALHR